MGRSVIATEGAGVLNKKASAAYYQLSDREKECLEDQTKQANAEERSFTRREIARRGEKIFMKIQQLVSL